MRPGDAFDNTCESTFFEIKFFKKGTVHLTFKDEKVWEQFNLAACAGKNWLPESEMRSYRQQGREQEPQEQKPIMISETSQAGQQLSLLEI
jgi:hypothetical protein